MNFEPIVITVDEILAQQAARPSRPIKPAPGETQRSPSYLAKRIVRGVRRFGASGCWLWGQSEAGNYGVVTIDGHYVGAHRISLALALGKDERSIDRACHNCPGGDNRSCVNPSHLFEGSQSDNIRDAVAKGCVKSPALRGQYNPAAKLNDARVNEIRAMVTGGVKRKDIALKFGVSRACINLIVWGQSWRHTLAAQ